jgi:capsular exopolysaccharide synthesis family protein
VTVELNRSNIRLLDPAERPLAPISPNRRQDSLYGLLTGLIMACGVVFAFEQMDSRIKNPDEIRQHLGMPSLALLPAVHFKRGKTPHPLINNGVPPAFGEAFRVLRTNLLFSSAEEGCRTMAVTSTGPGEGKSVVSNNLAIALAQTNQRVLIIDADMRQPRGHVLLDMLQEPGLSNLMVGDAKASECVRKTSVNGLWAVTAGRVPPNPAELVGSPRFHDLLQSLRQHFDWIIVDTPPVMAVADAALVGHVTQHVLFVVGTDMTSRRTAGHALERLELAKARVVGVVLNRVDFQRNAYYYSQYYRSEYADYYLESPTLNTAPRRTLI